MKREYKNITRALDLVRQARSAFDLAEYDPLLNALEARRVDLERRIKAVDDIRFGIKVLRPAFYYGMSQIHLCVARPTPAEDLPHISLDGYKALQLVLHHHGDGIRVDAEYDVEIKEHGVSYGIVPGRPK